jgi:CheY-like chemotaxis protein
MIRDKMNAAMEPYRVLVVDDRREMRDVMCSTVESLGSRVDVIAVPSGEEALLELRLHNFDLLVADVLLAGMNGMELMSKAKERRPELKVILVTGVLDRQLRREAAGAGADAFFLKPMEPGDFLDSVIQCLGLEELETQQPERVEAQPPKDQAPEDRTPEDRAPDDRDSEESISERLGRLHQDLDSIASVLVDDQGRVHSQAGELPEIFLETGLSPLVSAAFNTSSQVAKYTEANTQKGLLFFSGQNFDVLLAYVGGSYALVEIVDPIDSRGDFSRITRSVYDGARDLIEILLNMGNHIDLEDQEIDENDLSAEAPVLDALFQGLDAKVPGSREVDAFWDSLTEDRTAGGVQGTDIFTYDQALQMGLTPGEDEED